MSSCLFRSDRSSESRLWCSSDWKFIVGCRSPLDVMTKPNQRWGSVVCASTSLASWGRNMSGRRLNDCRVFKFQCNHEALFLTKTGFWNPPALLETRGGIKHGHFCYCLRFFSFEVQFFWFVCSIVPSASPPVCWSCQEWLIAFCFSSLCSATMDCNVTAAHFALKHTLKLIF